MPKRAKHRSGQTAEALKRLREALREGVAPQTFSGIFGRAPLPAELDVFVTNYATELFNAGFTCIPEHLKSSAIDDPLTTPPPEAEPSTRAAVLRRVGQTFPDPAEGGKAIGVLDRYIGGSEAGTAHIHQAILRRSEGKLWLLRERITLARIDWRDVWGG